MLEHWSILCQSAAYEVADAMLNARRSRVSLAERAEGFQEDLISANPFINRLLSAKIFSRIVFKFCHSAGLLKPEPGGSLTIELPIAPPHGGQLWVLAALKRTMLVLGRLTATGIARTWSIEHFFS